MHRRSVSDVAALYLEQWLDQTMRGELPLHRLPAPVAAFYHAGWAAATAQAQQQAREYEQRLDLAHLQAYAPKDRAELLQRRLDQHFAQQDALFFAEPQIEGPAPHFERRAA